jgi:hypothetical protein
MSWETLQEIAGNLGIIVAILVGIGLIWAKGVRPMFKFVAATVRAADALEEAVPVLKEIAEEFKPNHGTSLKDTVNRMDRNIKTNSENAATIYRMVAAMEHVDPVLLDPLRPLEEPPARQEGH